MPTILKYGFLASAVFVVMSLASDVRGWGHEATLFALTALGFSFAALAALAGTVVRYEHERRRVRNRLTVVPPPRDDTP